MDKKRIELVVTAVLVLILILSWANSIKISKRRKGAAPAKAASAKLAPAEKEAVGASEQDWQSLEWARDPFTGRVYSGEASGPIDLQLQGILWDEKKPRALIGGEIVGKGDALGNNVVIKISKDSVLLNDGTNDLELKLE